MKKVRVQQLHGAELNWAVAKVVCPDDLQYFPMVGRWGIDCFGDGPFTVVHVPRYASEWEFGGPIIEEYFIHVGPRGASWAAVVDGRTASVFGHPVQSGPVALCAAMRALVACKLGDEIEVPDDLA